tara:strand:+ start:1670 stop:1843 length:174 start_codon:yes stop_codon:yes gene_type:complete
MKDFIPPKFTHEVMVVDSNTGLEFSYSRHPSASSAMKKLEILKTITTYPPTIRKLID